MTECKYCKSKNLKTIKTPNLKHYAKLVCGDCEKWHKWISDPAKLEYKAECERMLNQAKLTPFVESLKAFFEKRGYLTEKQFESLKNLRW